MKIYLDSQHISRFSEDQSLFRRIFSEYKGEFGFSFVHIHECLPKDLNKTAGGLGRIEFMMNLENSKFLIQAYDIFKIEDSEKFIAIIWSAVSKSVYWGEEKVLSLIF